MAVKFFAESKYVEYQVGSLPIIIVAPHGGYVNPDCFPELPEKHKNDRNSQEYARALAHNLRLLTGKYPHLIVNHIRTEKFNPARSKEVATNGNKVLGRVWDQFHGFIEEAKAEVTRTWGSGHYYECHVNGHDKRWIEVGQGVSPERLNTPDSEVDKEEFIRKSCIRHLATTCGKDFFELIRGERSLGGLLEEKGYRVIPSPKNKRPDANKYFFAGWNLWKHGSRDGGKIDATHLETHWSYLVKPHIREKYCKDLAEVIVTWMNEHYPFDLVADRTTTENEPVLRKNRL